MIEERPLELPLPRKRPRRMRTTSAIRGLVAETRIAPEQLVTPYFVIPGRDEEQPIESLPGVARYTVDRLLRQLERGLEQGVRSAVLFGVVGDSDKGPEGRAAHDEAGPVATALREARSAFGDDLVLITDVCLCGYTDHGHCGVLSATSRGTRIDNDASLERLARMALAHAEAGADLVSPSDMMDGRVAAIRSALDGGGFGEVGILSYAIKYASAFYGPFREAAGSSPKGGGNGAPKDRKSYQMDPVNSREALREARIDEEEGADMLMVKPALAYLDVLARLRPRTELPLAAYQVSGEYAMLKAAASAGVLDEADAVRESLLAIRRAGADFILSYYSVEALEKGWLES